MNRRGLGLGMVLVALLTVHGLGASARTSAADGLPASTTGERRAADPVQKETRDGGDLPVPGEPTLPSAVSVEQEGHDHLPRFRYVVRRGDSLSRIAQRFGSSLSWLQGANPQIVSVHTIYAGEDIVVPIEFPLPDGAAVERMEVMQDRFLGSYRIERPFTEVQQLLTWQLEALRQMGFEAGLDENGLEHGITLRGRGVVLGKLVFTAAGSEDATQVDVGLLFTDVHDDPHNLFTASEEAFYEPSAAASASPSSPAQSL